MLKFCSVTLSLSTGIQLIPFLSTLIRLISSLSESELSPEHVWAFVSDVDEIVRKAKDEKLH